MALDNISWSRKRGRWPWIYQLGSMEIVGSVGWSQQSWWRVLMIMDKSCRCAWARLAGVNVFEVFIQNFLWELSWNVYWSCINFLLDPIQNFLCELSWNVYWSCIHFLLDSVVTYPIGKRRQWFPFFARWVWLLGGMCLEAQSFEGFSCKSFFKLLLGPSHGCILVFGAVWRIKIPQKI